MNQLVDVDVDGVHLVGEPANKRRFAIVKGLTRSTSDGDRTVKIDDLKKKLDGIEGDVTPDKVFAAVLSGEGAEPEKIVKAMDESARKALAKALGVELQPKDPPVKDPKKIEKDKLPAEVRAYVDGLEKDLKGQGETLDAIVKDREAAVKADLEKRVAVLKERGFEPEGESPTEAQIAAMEKASEKFASHMKEIGVLEMHGTDDRPAGSAREAVAKSVRERLGREPASAVEEAQTRSAIYRENPGLLQTVIREERAAS